MYGGHGGCVSSRGTHPRQVENVPWGASEILLLRLSCGRDVLFQNITLDSLTSKTIFKEINAQNKKGPVF